MRPFALAVSTILYTAADADTTESVKAIALYLTIVEMAKTYNLNLYEYLKFLFYRRPSKDMPDEEFENLAP